jgi:hypothetical protein
MSPPLQRRRRLEYDLFFGSRAEGDLDVDCGGTLSEREQEQKNREIDGVRCKAQRARHARDEQ